jgi:hypothetical protein
MVVQIVVVTEVRLSVRLLWYLGGQQKIAETEMMGQSRR